MRNRMETMLQNEERLVEENIGCEPLGTETISVYFTAKQIDLEAEKGVSLENLIERGTNILLNHLKTITQPYGNSRLNTAVEISENKNGVSHIIYYHEFF